MYLDVKVSKEKSRGRMQRDARLPDVLLWNEATDSCGD